LLALLQGKLGLTTLPSEAWLKDQIAVIIAAQQSSDYRSLARLAVV